MILKSRPIVAESAGVPIHVDETIRSVTFTDSPYYAHVHLSAIDIYPLNPACLVPSPVSGRIVGIRSVKAPIPKFFKADEDEKLLLIANDKKLVTKILHLSPLVKVGEEVEVSTPLGRYVRSGFFNFWTDHHMHVEVRPSDDPIRARGSFPIFPRLLGNYNAEESEDIDPNQIPCKVVSVSPEYLLLKPPRGMFCSLGGYVGTKVRVDDNTVGILDGGLPHYSFGGVLQANTTLAKTGSEVCLGGLPIGQVQEGTSTSNGPDQHYAMIKFKKGIRVQLSGRPLSGLALSLFLSSSCNMLLKAVPPHPYYKEELITFRANEVLSVTVHS
jgi:hypothetical protein